MIFEKIQGLIAATFTPFGKSGKLNTGIIPTYHKHLKKNQINGAFICGTTGEAPSLSLDEKIDLIKSWSFFNSKNFKVIAMVSGTNQKEGIALAQVASSQLLYGIAVTAPYYFKPSTVDQLVDFIKPIAAAASGQAVYFYHIPLLTGVNLSMLELLDKAGRAIPNFAGIKYTHNDLMEFNRCLRFKGGEYDILWGWDETFLAGLSMGAKGAVGSTYNFAAPLYHDILEAFKSGDMNKALEVQQKSIDFISLYGKYGGSAAGKAIMNMIGVACGDFRSPVVKLEEDQLNSLSQELEDLGFFADLKLSRTSNEETKIWM